MGNPTDIFTNVLFACLMGFVVYLLFVGLSKERYQREQAARLAFKIAIREGRPRKDAMRRYKQVKREWKRTSKRETPDDYLSRQKKREE